MNPIQKAWLRVLGPVITLVNDKMAKRSGMVGRFGRFFAFGPRQYGFHPFNKFLKIMNNVFIQSTAHSTHNHSFIKNLSLNGTVSSRPFAFHSLFGKVILFWSMLHILIPRQFEHEEGTTLEHLTRHGIPVPYNALNDRVSAHYTQISSLYTSMVAKTNSATVQQIQQKWNRTSDKVKKTRFARPGYKYIEAHSKAAQ